MHDIKSNKWPLIVGAGLGAVALTVGLSSSWVSIPKGATAVQPFNLQKYLGKWFEIARMPFRFEKSLRDVTAVYTLNSDDSIRVDNRGYDVKEQKWKESIGKAKIVNDPNEARLKVSFFGPFYAGYNVLAIDADYNYALVAGHNLSYLWILSRVTSIPENVKTQYLQLAESLGYQTDKLIWTKHSSTE
ncbi:lipocalin [Mucilaginibacter robiniae]|uniref:Outer membrane lipoprotein Blc n=1 Tax=Mucilaginibacter robiniae TaxID=2728022 RepID=A0A7L5DWJ0_9SPHI|nr:lipocalin family protein [Mucilaginibacter robiniae]QJD95452.1 lipocalin [Mucilaginibacter robiniae]